MYMEQNIDSYCFLIFLCVFVLFQFGMVMLNMGMLFMSDFFNLDMMFGGGNILICMLLMEEMIWVWKSEDYVVLCIINIFCIDFFLFVVYYGLEMYDKVWFYLWEVIILVYLLRMNEEIQYMQYDSNDVVRCRCLYWLFFVIEWCVLMVFCFGIMLIVDVDSLFQCLCFVVLLFYDFGSNN